MSHLISAEILINIMVICDLGESPFGGIVDSEARLQIEE